MRLLLLCDSTASVVGFSFFPGKIELHDLAMNVCFSHLKVAYVCISLSQTILTSVKESCSHGQFNTFYKLLSGIKGSNTSQGYIRIWPFYFISQVIYHYLLLHPLVNTYTLD